MPPPHPAARRIIVFGRYPIPGHTKTRLILSLGPTGAAEVQRILTEHIVRVAKEAAIRYGCNVDFYFESSDVQTMQQWLGRDMTFYPQEKKDLGQRMYLAFQQAFQDGAEKVILLGTDIPDITPEYIFNAFETLKNHTLTLGPASDGGYFLVGMKRLLNVFSSIAWSTPEVLNQTIQAAKALDIETTLLPKLTDIDTIEDLKAVRPELSVRRPYISVIIPTLNESENITTAIASAEHEDAEIIVVDGGSTDNTLEKAKNKSVTIIQSPPGRAIQQNKGAAAARGSVLLFLHADTILPKNYIREVFDAIIRPDVILGAFGFKTDDHRIVMKGIEFMTNIRAKYLKLPYGDQGLFIKKSRFDQRGGFPQTPVAEDFFFVRHILKHGNLKIVSADIITSARRWHSVGIMGTFLINQIIVLGCCLGIPASKLAPLYRTSRK